MMFSAYTHNGDAALLRSLGLKTSANDASDANDNWNDLGTVEVFKAEEKEVGRPKVMLTYPAVTVKVEVFAAPAQFWRFTVTRNDEEIVRETDDGRWGCDVWQEVYVVRTGSGSFGDYWPAVRLIADNSFEVERKTREKVAG